MQAIRLTRANLNKILNESPIDRRDLEAMIEEYDKPAPFGPQVIFFVPKHDLAHDLDRNSWMTLPYRLLNESYRFDANKINTEFVEITQK